jgi:hypothetical protein
MSDTKTDATINHLKAKSFYDNSGGKSTIIAAESGGVRIRSRCA